MLLYHTTHRANLFTSSSERETNPISCARFDNTHFAFAGEPLAGQGSYVYSVDIPATDAQPYLFKNDFRKEVTSHYALPWELVAKQQPTCELYVDVTGVPWNVHVISVLDTHAKKGEKSLLGSYSLVWASREGVAKVKIHDRSDEALRVAVETTKDFNPEKDYIIAEVHEEFETPVGAASNEAWILNTVAGFPPAWQTFPFAWQTWVHDLTVTESALTYLTTHMPRYRRDMEQAQRLDSKHNRARAWREIGDEMSHKLSVDAGREVTLGKFAGHSWTAVMALPLRMAMRLGSLA